ncbi:MULTISPECIES: signal peptide peptidase SppA [unclassified Nitratiruptor]|uniref:signal peptide peptidase SppA n=1 Tax=unclassified Nitratiruptor TaxID=2624044 RepID=UPI0019158713|nr:MULTISPECIES: signal peptide peptidase SppA [unclassified Nitratiruptor]BCD59768.1 protease IV [Nitratiruptor sp. YY08-10]BCD63692.1 protease IV [Nitratiruptor sp. YY08-14]
MSENKNSITSFFSTLFSPLTALLDFLQKYFKGILLLIALLLLIGALQKTTLQKPNLMEIRLNGPIIDAKNILKKIELAEQPNIKGVLFVVSSPGGAVAPSIEISRAIKRLNAKKPVITYAAGTLASGSYYASIWSKKIIANPGSAVGSIGVILEAPNLKGLLDKLGVAPQVVKAGKYKEAGTPFRPWKTYEKEELQKVINDTYDMFVHDVAKARGLDPKNKDQFAEAHIFTARQAQKVGLIDEIGDYFSAKKELEKISGVRKAIWAKEDPWEKFMDQVAQKSSTMIVDMLFGLKLF